MASKETSLWCPGIQRVVSVTLPKDKIGDCSCVPGLDATRKAAPPEASESDEALKSWLLKHGINDVETWGEGTTKTVSALRTEVLGKEMMLELWEQPDGTESAMRVIHVLRGKVSTPQYYAEKVFACNTWQQFPDGRRRDRNALMSEKLSADELPINKNLEAVCRRAMAEEMECVVDTTVVIDPDGDGRIPEFSEDLVTPLKVMQSKLVEHTIEMEQSPSFPGLMTMYHIYTVDIVAEGLPSADFHTLEFKPPKDDKRALKYIHAWKWLNWTTIRGYLNKAEQQRNSNPKAVTLDVRAAPSHPGEMGCCSAGATVASEKCGAQATNCSAQ
eukprot:gnl/TRDRNA2_/TRDRNA2_55319_c0_seq1.p1 gnl/TRDRNA2_/TRDRNA2_55319_c0~~gnl/TRDRNA2_/TRDRNA2_55319_c0_seq1.p1  ORF type:complete len:330 (-),score=83.46 gnl/TRDRNA2_/TRDRNA2_55319_c0_seq1:241-1230(-)